MNIEEQRQIIEEALLKRKSQFSTGSQAKFYDDNKVLPANAEFWNSNEKKWSKPSSTSSAKICCLSDSDQIEAKTTALIDESGNVFSQHYCHSRPLSGIIAKRFLQFFSFILMSAGLSLIALSVYSLLETDHVHIQRLVLLSHMFNEDTEPVEALYLLDITLFVSGWCLFLTGVMAAWANAKQSVPCLFAVGSILPLLAISNFMISGLALSFMLKLSTELPPQLVGKIQNFFNIPNHEEFTIAIDYVQTKFQCCGQQNGSDYYGSAWYIKALGGQFMKVPLTCCVLNNQNMSDSFLNPQPKNLHLCMKQINHSSNSSRDDYTNFKTDSLFIHPQGCRDEIEDWANLELMMFVFVGIGSAVLNLVSTFIVVKVTRNLLNARKRKKTFRKLTMFR